MTVLLPKTRLNPLHILSVVCSIHSYHCVLFHSLSPLFRSIIKICSVPLTNRDSVPFKRVLFHSLTPLCSILLTLDMTVFHSIFKAGSILLSKCGSVPLRYNRCVVTLYYRNKACSIPFAHITMFCSIPKLDGFRSH